MNKSGQTAASAPTFGASLVYCFVQLLLSPLLVLGYVLYMITFLRAGKNAGGTAQAPLLGRWTQHRLGSRPDELSYRLMEALPGVSHAAMKLLFVVPALAHRASGYLPRSFRYPFEGEISLQDEGFARQTFFDTVVERYLAGAAQFVILGAGFDTRALRLTPDVALRAFEVDAAGTQAIKREALKRAGIDAAGLTLVAADFEKDDWLALLVDAGFDPGRPTLLIWEGVTMYLDRAAVEVTLRKVAGLAPGSVVAFDYYTTEVLESRAWMMRYARMGTRAVGSPLKFGIDATPPSQERIAEFLQACGLALAEHHSLGMETGGKRAWGGFAVATVR
ncbi:MAG TPA: SAM-dependent methyltransferase [Rectinemataceae bacterium]|nr:SAM-dependent methyltransferase [Rectinemataceae bacterium]